MIDSGRGRYVAIYNDGFRGDDEVEGFMRKYALEKRCDTVQELAEMVDIGFIQGCNWDKHLFYAEIGFRNIVFLHIYPLLLFLLYN